MKNYRRCVSCRKLAPKESFWRIVRVYPSGTVKLDRGMGRSAYICPQASCLKIAQKKNRLGRSLKTKIPPEIYPTLWQRLESILYHQLPTIEANLDREITHQRSRADLEVDKIKLDSV